MARGRHYDRKPIMSTHHFRVGSFERRDPMATAFTIKLQDCAQVRYVHLGMKNSAVHRRRGRGYRPRKQRYSQKKHNGAQDTTQRQLQAYLDGLRKRDLRPLRVQLGLECRGRQGQRDHLSCNVTVVADHEIHTPRKYKYMSVEKV